jgi:hypothetical protein
MISNIMGGRYMSKNKDNKLYVFVKGFKEKGAFEITDSHFTPIQDRIIMGEKNEDPQSMDRKAILKSLEYIKNNRSKFPEHPVIFIFTTYENNYDIALGKKNTNRKATKDFQENYKKLQDYFFRPEVKLNDEVKCFWIPKHFTNRMEEVTKFLEENKQSNLKVSK